MELPHRLSNSPELERVGWKIQRETISEGEDGRGLGGRSLAAGSAERGETGMSSGINHPI